MFLIYDAAPLCAIPLTQEGLLAIIYGINMDSTAFWFNHTFDSRDRPQGVSYEEKRFVCDRSVFAVSNGM
jgi:hypothetical protein